MAGNGGVQLARFHFVTFDKGKKEGVACSTHPFFILPAKRLSRKSLACHPGNRTVTCNKPMCDVEILTMSLRDIGRFVPQRNMPVRRSHR
ncbi:hypothetical protein HA47_12985 [Pantoea stewartii subsp. indologenes]|nr:hypothetical protein HA47_12985 [Pantoea stewartii subsp. indologenes]KTS27483.1 hypothetical protein NS381_13245 [Pantoea stewartii]